ncbi:MAG: hypothetical protein ACTHNY_11915 [Solirubrobacterales bacterium]
MHLVSERRDHRLVAVGFASIALALVAVLAFAARAQAAETIYWNNYDTGSISFADINGSGGGLLNLGGATLEEPEGMAYDSATGRIYVASSAENGEHQAILYANADGSGGGVFTAPGAPVEVPKGIAVDPVNRTIYWANSEEGATISWARLDGSAGGTLNTSGTTVEWPDKVAVDPVHGKVYWFNIQNQPYTIGYANADNSGGGGTLDLTGATPPKNVRGLVVDPAANRLYWLTGGSAEMVSYVSLSGGGGGDIDFAEAPVFNPYGLALDPSINRLYWGNYANGEEREDAIGFASTTGGGFGGITPSTAPVNGPQDPLILKSPSGTGAPAVTRDAANPPALSCSTGGWAADYAGSFVYQAPRSFGYQWLLNGAAVPGAVGSTLTATAAGSYTCTVTATNQSGSASQTSGAATTVSAASVKLTVKPKKAKAKPGKAAKFKVSALNQGDLQTGNAKLCVKVPKKAKKALKAPKCKTLGAVGALTTKATKIKVKVKKSAAKGSYKVTLQVKGTAGKAVKATVKVLG